MGFSHFNILLNILILLLIIWVKKSYQKQLSFCANFLKCEAHMMSVHKKCTEKARNATGLQCGLNDDFRQLNVIMNNRLLEFADCVSTINPFGEYDEDRISEFECRRISINSMAEESSCWRTVAKIRTKCLQLQRCCPSAKNCKKQGQQSAYTQELRAKHIEINRRTLECREQMQMQRLFDMKQQNNMSPKALGPVISIQEQPIDISNSYEFANGDDQVQQESVKRLAEAIAKVLLKRQLGRPPNSKDALSILTKTNDLGNDDTPLAQSPTKHYSSILVFDKNERRTKGLMQKNNLLKFLKKPYEKQGIFSTNSMLNGKIPFLIAARQPQSFAIPYKVNLKKMGVYEARPELKKVISQEWTIGGMLSKFPTSTMRIMSNESTITYTPDKLLDFEPVVHGVKTVNAQKEENDVKPFQRLTEAYVYNQKLLEFDNPSSTTTIPVPQNFNDLLQLKNESKEAKKQGKIESLIHTPDTSVRQELFMQEPKIIDFDTGEFPQSLAPQTKTSPAPRFLAENVSASEFYPQYVRTTKLVPAKEKSLQVVSGWAGTTKIPPSFHILKEIHITMAPTNIAITQIPPYNDSKTANALSKNSKKVLYGIGQRNQTTIGSVLDNPTFPQHNLYTDNSIDSEANELMHAKDELIKNLEEFIRKREKPVHGRVDTDFEAERLEALRKTRQEYEIENQLTGYCELYSTCTDQLRYVQKQCEASNGRLMPGLPRRRFGDCHAKLVFEYESLDAMKAKVESSFDNCLIEEIIDGTASRVKTCPMDWPTLPPFEYLQKCSLKLLSIKNHCRKLARCCNIVPKCRKHVELLAVSREYSVKSQILSRKSAMCQIRAYNDYYQRYKLHAAARQQAHEKLSKYQKVVGYSSKFSSKNQLDSNKFLDTKFRLL